MDPKVLLELYGYLGSCLVVVSMLMASVVKLRVINTVGSIISGSYALIIGSFPLALMNICLIIINVYNLYKLLKTKQQFEIVKTNGADGYVKYFLNRYKDDIETFFPGFEAKNSENELVFVTCCNGNPAGILLGNDLDNGVIDVIVDYSVPAYRDCSVGTYLYGNLGKLGIKKLMFTQNKAEAHTSYLTKMGFQEVEGEYVKDI